MTWLTWLACFLFSIPGLSGPTSDAECGGERSANTPQATYAVPAESDDDSEEREPDSRKDVPWAPDDASGCIYNGF